MAWLAACVRLILWPDYCLVVDSLRIGSGAVLCSGCGMLVWPVMAECVAWLSIVMRPDRGLFYVWVVACLYGLLWLNVWPGYNLFVVYLEAIAWTILWASLMP